MATFTIATSGTEPITIQWQQDTAGDGIFADMVGETGTTLTVDDGSVNSYRANVSNACGAATSNIVMVTTGPTCKIYECDALEGAAETLSLAYFPLLDPNFRTNFGSWDLDKFTTASGRMYWPLSGDPTTLPFTWLSNIDIFEYSEPFASDICNVIRGPIGWRFDTPNTNTSPRYDQAGKTGTNIEFNHDFNFSLVTKNVVWLGSPTLQSGNFVLNSATVQQTFDNGNRGNNSNDITIAYVNESSVYYIGYDVESTGGAFQIPLPVGVNPASSDPLFLGFSAKVVTSTEYPEGVRYERNVGLGTRNGRWAYDGYIQLRCNVFVNGTAVETNTIYEKKYSETWIISTEDPYTSADRFTFGSKARNQTWFAGYKGRALSLIHI